MTQTFIIKWLLSLIVGSSWVTLSTMIAEKVSGKIGGLILGLPSTAVVSLLFVGITQDIDASIEAATVVPLSSGLYCFFFLTYLLLTRKGFKIALTGSLLVWFSFAVLAFLLNIKSFTISVIAWLIIVPISIFIVTKFMKIDNDLKPKKKSSSSLLFKAVVSGIVISTIVLLSKLLGAVWGGIFATFPALTISTLLITAKSGDLEFTKVIMKNVLISTTTTIGIYAIIVRFVYPEFGIYLGTLISYAIMLLISAPLYYLVFERVKKL